MFYVCFWIVLKMFHNCTEGSCVNFTAINFGALLVSMSYVSLSIIGLALQLLVIIVILKLHCRAMTSFHIMLINLCVSECVVYLLHSCYSIPYLPITIQSYNNIVYQILTNLETVDFLVIVISTFVISFNRGMAISQPHLHRKIFTRKITYRFIPMIWIFACMIVIVDGRLSCRTVFVQEKFHFSQVCDNHSPSLALTSFCVYFFVYGVALFYGYALYELRKLRHTIVQNIAVQKNLTNHKRRLFYQSFFIWLTLFINVLCKALC